MQSRIVAAMIALSAALGASAAEASGGKEGTAKPDVGQYVDLQPVALPIVVQGRLVNYSFVSVRIVLNTATGAARWREKEPYFRDALVRAAHRSPFVKEGDWQEVDAARLSATLMREAVAITGPGIIRQVVVSSQAPRRRIAPPRPVQKPS